MIKCAWIVFHANISRYKKAWIEDYRNSYFWQTVKIPVYEINYGTSNERLFKNSTFYKKQFEKHASAHNFILDEVFKAGFEYAFNSNVDDIYAAERVERQMQELYGHDIISCNHSIINGENEIIVPDIQFSTKSVGYELSKNPPHNIISHPGVVYSKRFWEKCPKLNPASIPTDDMELWQWAYANGFKFHIVPATLVYYRVYDTSVSAPRQKQFKKV